MFYGTISFIDNVHKFLWNSAQYVHLVCPPLCIELYISPPGQCAWWLVADVVCPSLSSWVHDYQEACIDKMEGFMKGHVTIPRVRPGESMSCQGNLHGGSSGTVP